MDSIEYFRRNFPSLPPLIESDIEAILRTGNIFASRKGED